MKKLLVFATIIGLMGFSWVASFAQVKQSPASKIEPKLKTQQRIVITDPSIQKIISAENDKSQTKNSPIQRYRVVYETTDGQKGTLILQTEENNKGEILKVAIVSGPKSASASIGAQAKCPAERPYLHCMVIIDWRTGVRYYICWCSAYR